MASKKQLQKDVSKLQKIIDKQNEDIKYWKAYVKFLDERIEKLEEARDENVLLKNRLANAVSDLNNLRWKSGFVHTACFYNDCTHREYCDDCTKNDYRNWEWRGNIYKLRGDNNGNA